MGAPTFIVLLSCLACVNSAPPIDIKPYCKLTCPRQDGKQTQNTVCRYKCELSKKCTKFKALPFDQQERQNMLDLHNIYRQKVASGNDKRGENGAAANMMVLNYDIELEVPAMCWGMQCHWGHDECRKTPKFSDSVGQNLYEVWKTGDISMLPKRSVNESMSGWYEEIRFTTKGRLDKYNSKFTTEERRRGMMIGHYTQLVWAKTTHVGCTRVTYRRYEKAGNGLVDVIYVLCDYAPGGNYVDQPTYEFGAPASKCPSGTKANAKYPALCGELQKIPIDKLFPDNIGGATHVSTSKFLLTLLALIVGLSQLL